jgi:hypothetical protein
VTSIAIFTTFSTKKSLIPVPFYRIIPLDLNPAPTSYLFSTATMVCAHDGRRGSGIVFLFLATLITLNEGFKMPAKGMRFPGSKRNAAITIPEKDPKFDFGPLGKLAFSLLPLSPESVGRRKTIFTEVVAGKVWTLDQVANNYHPPLDNLK